jgi:hypothetical protein
MMMMAYSYAAGIITLGVFFALYFLLAWLRSGRGGRLGRMVRGSDWLAWRDEMDRRERQLEKLRKAEPRR